MSKYTVQQYSAVANAIEDGDARHPGMVADMLRQAAAHLARQSEGVSDELPDDIRVPLDEVRADLGYLFGRVAADGSFMQAAVDSVRLKLDKVSAALQSVRPPVGFIYDDFKATATECVKDIRKHAKQVHDLPLLQQDLRRLANRIERKLSRHAPTKD